MKEITLTNGGTTIVDDDIYDQVSQFEWKRNVKLNYAMRYVENKNEKRIVYLHHCVLPLHPVLLVDHINRNVLDNRKENLRYCTKSQNLANRPAQKNNKTSIYKGVCFQKRTGKWVAQVQCKGKQVFQKRFSTEEEAAHAYDYYAKKYFGEFAYLKRNYGMKHL